jgi:hypothetical protein
VRFGHVERAKGLVKTIKKILEASPRSKLAEFIPMRVLAAKALRDAGLEKEYREALTELRAQIEFAPENLQFELSIALADLVDRGDRQTMVAVLRQAECSASVSNERQTRAKQYTQVAGRWAAAGCLMEARKIAERASVPEEMLKGYSAVLGIKPYDVESTRPLNWFAEFDAQRIKELVENALRADDQRLTESALDPDDPIEPSSKVAALVCRLTSKGMVTNRQKSP